MASLEVTVDNQPKKILFDTLFPWNEELDPRRKWCWHDTHRQVEQILDALDDSGYSIVRVQGEVRPGSRHVPTGDFTCDRRPLLRRLLDKFKRES